MPFNRQLNEVTLRELTRLASSEATSNWWKELLAERFALGWRDDAGQAVMPDQPLFVAVRDGYINAYVDGQSVLQFKFVERGGQAQLSAQIHWKYVFCNALQRGDYLKFDGAGIIGATPQGGDTFVESSTLHDWVRRAQLYAGREKQGVAVIVARHPQIIDLEMGLTSVNGGDSATRMDIVALEDDGEGARIVFYEVKLFSNPELRAENLLAPVQGQLQGYRNWINSDGREEEVVSAYRRACRIYLQFQAMRTPGSTPPMHPLIERAAIDATPLTVDRNPRLVITDYKPAKDLVSPADPSWARHENALREAGIRLIMAPRPEDIVLPTSAPLGVAASPANQL